MKCGSNQVLLPTYNILDGAQSLLEVHKVGRRLVGGFGVKTILPRKFGRGADSLRRRPLCSVLLLCWPTSFTCVAHNYPAS